MDEQRNNPARDHPRANALGEKDDARLAGVQGNDTDPEARIAATLAKPGNPKAIPEDSSEPRPHLDAIPPPPTPAAMEPVLEGVPRATTPPQRLSVEPIESDEFRFTFPPPISQLPHSITPVAFEVEEELRAPLRHRRRPRRPQERAVIAGFAALGASILTFAAYDIARPYLANDVLQGDSAVKNTPTEALQVAAAARTAPWEMPSAVIRIPTSTPPTVLPPRARGEVPFDSAAANLAVDSAATEASLTCAPGGQSALILHVRVGYAPSGEAGSVTVRGTLNDPPAVLACVERIFRKSKVAPFTGPSITFSRWVQVP